MTILKTLAKTLRRFRREDAASTLPIMGAIIIPLLGFVGLATDAARGYVIKTRLHDALDAAGLAAAHEVESADFSQQFESYFFANFPQGYLGATVTLAPPVPSSGNKVISYNASATVNTTFMRLLGVNSLDVSSFTEVKRATTSLDVVLSIDMSGSMAGSRIAAARDASHLLLDILYGGSETNDLLQVGLVPWSANVNVMLNGSTFDRTLTQTVPLASSFTNPITGLSQSEVYITNVSPVPFLVNPLSSWKGCAFARYGDDGEVNDGDIHVGTGTFGVTTPMDWMAWEHNPTTGSKCLSHGITPLQKNKTIIADAVDELTSPTSNTNIAQGFAWAWRVLSPTAPFEDANPNPKGNHQRAIILLTDGEQTGTSSDAFSSALNGGSNPFGSGSSAGPAGMDDRLRAVSDNAKATGVKVFVIQYAFSSGPLRALLESVATGPTAPYYHFAPDAEALEAAFEEIADELSELRLSQ